jgi:branched-chain amino acid:cation transporter, LIVCS family
VKKLGVLSLAVAVFAMFFGAGNIVFPLSLGRDVGHTIPFAMVGFILTAVIVPIIGFIATILYEGDYDKFFSTIGKIPAFALITLCMLIIGPLGASRCVIISYAAIEQYLPFSLFFYTLIVGAIVFLLTIKENRVVGILGKFLGPVKIVLLLSIIVFVFFSFKEIPHSASDISQSLLKGLKEGYFTLDLIGSFFFSHLIYSAMLAQQNNGIDQKTLAKKGIKAGLLGGLFLAIIYTGFGFVTAIHSSELQNILPENLFSAMASTILGPKGSILANLTIAIATITTAIALTAVFADYICVEICRKKVPYVYVLIVAIIINIIMENLQFAGIMKIIVPIAIAIYPAFIVLSIANIFKKMFGFKYIKSVVLLTFILTLYIQYIH